MRHRIAICSLLLTFFSSAAFSQNIPGNLTSDMKQFVETVAIPGYEQDLAREITSKLTTLKPTTDNLGDVIVTIGSGAPHRLVVAPMDEPGYVVSGIDERGYLRVARLPQGGALPQWNELYSAQPVRIKTAQGKWIDGVVAGLSVHLSGRPHPPDANDIENMFVDIGAKNEADVHAAGANLLSPLALDRQFFQMGFGKWTGVAIGDRFGDAALIEVLRHLDRSKIKGTLTVAFAAQQWTGGRGLMRLLEDIRPDELIYVGRLSRPAGRPGEAPPQWSSPLPGVGVVIGTQTKENENELTSELKQLAAKDNVKLTTNSSGPLIPRGYAAPPPVPARFVHLAVATSWPSTPAEIVDGHDVAQLVTLLEDYLQGSGTAPQIENAAAISSAALPKRPTQPPTPEAILKTLVEAYGVSEHEEPVRKVVAELLPSWAKPEADASGNLILRWGSPSQKPDLVVVAHMDELGFVVREIRSDGKLEVDNKGGGVPAYFNGHAALLHTANGIRPGVIDLPEGWDQPNFKWPTNIRTGAIMDVGATSADQVAQLGIKVGDFITIPKRYRRLLNDRASGRSMDDRVGCASLIWATWQLGPQLKNRNVMFVWSTGEELGLLGAADAAKRLADAKQAPPYVFAVDTFVSADSPLESSRFGDEKIGEGFVARAVDNSNITPRNLVEKLIAMAKAGHIAAQYGVTGGGNDGSAFVRYGSTDVAMGWPLRYSHSPAELISTHDLDALGRIVVAVARNW